MLWRQCSCSSCSHRCRRLRPLPRQFICDSEPYSGFAQAIQTMTSDSVTEQENALLPRAGSNEMVEAFDIQALPAVAQGLAHRWEPLYLATVVIAVDRGRPMSRFAAGATLWWQARR